MGEVPVSSSLVAPGREIERGIGSEEYSAEILCTQWHRYCTTVVSRRVDRGLCVSVEGRQARPRVRPERLMASACRMVS